MPAPGEKIEVGSEMIGEDQEPHLVGGADIQDAFEAEGAGCLVDPGGGVEADIAPGRGAIPVKREQEAGISQGVVVQGYIGKSCVAAEVRITALVDRKGGKDIGFQIIHEQVTFYVRPPDARVGKFCSFQQIECFLWGGGLGADERDGGCGGIAP